MAIVLTVQLKPSRILLWLTIGLGLMANLSAMLACSAFDMPRWLNLLLPVVALSLSSLAFASFWCVRKPVQLHISNSGQMTLNLPGTSRFPARSVQVELGEKSTLWPSLLSLYLRAEDGGLHKLLVLPDSLDDDSFRALSVALRWINRHKKED